MKLARKTAAKAVRANIDESKSRNDGQGNAVTISLNYF
jgi:hypothetical protein